MFDKIFDSVVKIFSLFKTSYALFMITLVIIHFTLNLNQDEFS